MSQPTKAELELHQREHGFNSITIVADNTLGDVVKEDWAFVNGSDEHGGEHGGWGHSCLNDGIYWDVRETACVTVGEPVGNTSVGMVTRYDCNVCGAVLFHLSVEDAVPESHRLSYAVELDTDDGSPEWERLMIRHDTVTPELIGSNESGMHHYRYSGSLGALLDMMEDEDGWSGMDRLHMLNMIKPTCPVHNRFLEFGGHYGAPGCGTHWECPEGHSWSQVGGYLHDPSSGAHILEPEDCV